MEPANRASFLEAACEGDAALRLTVERMVAADSDCADFLRDSAVAVAARHWAARGVAIHAGREFGPYRMISKLGSGGTGDVFLAIDSRLDRKVAVKVLPYLGAGARRVLREARAVSALNHPNIVTVYDVIEEPDCDALIMEYIDGLSLEQQIAGGPLPVDRALRYAIEIAGALEAAHSLGLIHRDVKPANILLAGGSAKILDFGLALTPEECGKQNGTIAGTVAYMSPEQTEGLSLHAKSDLFSFGTVLYEMLTGRRPFTGTSRALVLDAIRHASPAPVRSLRAEIPAALARIVERCLMKDPEARYASAAELRAALEQCAMRIEASSKSIWRRGWIRAAALVALAAAASWSYYAYQVRWLRTVALPEISRLVDAEHYTAAYRAALEANRRLPQHPELERIRRELWVPITIVTDPPGADVFLRDYAGVNDPWEPLGKSPVEKLRLPAGDFRVRVSKPGFDEVEGTVDQVTRLFSRKLPARGTAPPGMVFVPVDTFKSPASGTIKGSPFWLDRFEVTNRQFQAFVDAGGFTERRWWPPGITEKTMAALVDSTGHPGPSTWSNGHYPAGKDDLPVGGVSWYEAAAYAAFVGKSLPTSAHWEAAANFAHFSTILRLSNMSTTGPAPVGLFQGLGRYGAYDMAGNVTEWCSNARGERRVVRGGSWLDPHYMYMTPDAAPPSDRGEIRGFRCVLYTAPVPEPLAGEISFRREDHRDEKPVTDEVFQSFRSFYQYDRAPLNARVELVDDAYSGWRREKVAFDAAYGTGRVVVYLFLPRSSRPPFQSVILFPGGTAQREHTSENLELRRVDFLLRGGRAIVYPIYNGTYERNNSGPAIRGPHERRDLRIQWLKDIRTTIDYLSTRSDFDVSRIAYFGASAGLDLGAIAGALEPRIRTLVLQGCGLPDRGLPAEASPVNFLPRVRIPVLAINGRDDFINPLEENQKVMFRLFATPAKDKRHVVLNSGHSVPRADIMRETIPWLDHYLGPVAR